MSSPTYAEVIAEAHDCIRQAEQANDYETIMKYADLAKSQDDDELADELKTRAEQAKHRYENGSGDGWADDAHHQY